MSTASVDVMLSKPGIYLVAGRLTMFFVEVENGICYQLDETFTRDGVLYPGGWNINEIGRIFGPIVSKAPPPTQAAPG